MDTSQQMPPVPPDSKPRWLQPHSEAQIHVGPEFQAAIPELRGVPPTRVPPAGGAAPRQHASNGGGQ
eukprot:g3879.t1